MKHLFITIIIAMGVFFFLGIVFQILQHRRKPEVRYICDTCGEKDCQCHQAKKPSILNELNAQEEESKILGRKR